jgi:hypothetical protein
MTATIRFTDTVQQLLLVTPNLPAWAKKLNRAGERATLT